jgi:hypothetical protein
MDVEQVIREGTRDGATPHEQAALDIPFEGVASKIGTPDYGHLPIDNEHLGVH